MGSPSLYWCEGPFFIILNNALVQGFVQKWFWRQLLGGGEHQGQSLAHPGCVFMDTNASFAGTTAGSK